MNAQVSPTRSWNKVERVTSVTLIACLLAFIGSRLFFAVWWPLHPVDFVISTIAVILLIVSFRFAARRRNWRIAVVAYASATQLVPMVMREPALLLPLLGALIPLTILFGCLLALSKKGSRPQSTQGS
ncbi:MAG: LrgA [Rhodanobacter sp.]|nr:MAG: LrgA [Rhodanobacter sp.]TAM38034.1 MAG: LrgA [Rhodanobacter sp.]TAN25442.1 MAG: LrgA [Rhodanobacter sp.]